MIAHDVSLGGMMVTTATPRWPGELVRVRFKLPQSERAIRVTCRVVDLVSIPEGVGLALRFLKVAPLAQILLHDYIDRRDCGEGLADPVAKVSSWVKRIVEDCAQLKALASPLN
jgi:hypothetical protein